MEKYLKHISTQIIFFAFFLIGYSCSDSGTNINNSSPDNRHKVTIKEGVWGNV